MKNLFLLALMTTVFLPVIWACGNDDDDEPVATNSSATANSGGNSSLPPAPTNVLVVEGDEELTISWDEVSNAEKYELRYRAEAEEGEAEADFTPLPEAGGSDIATNPHTIVDLTNGTQYEIQVRWLDENDVESAWSASVLGRPFVLAKPEGIVVVPNDGQLTISWSEVEGATKYELRYKEADENNYDTEIVEGEEAITSTSFVIPNLENGTNYNLQVRAVNAHEQRSEWSDEAEGTPSDALQPPSLALVEDTGDVDNDGLTTNAAIRIASRPNVMVTLNITINSDSPVAQSVNSGSDGTIEVNMATTFPAIVPTGNETNALSITAQGRVMALDPLTAASEPLAFKVVVGPTQTEVDDYLEMLLSEDTGDDDDDITTNSIVVFYFGTLPDGAALSFAVTTNGGAHAWSPSTSFRDNASASTTFDLASPTELLEVSVVAKLTRHAHSVTQDAFEYTLFPWPSEISVAYVDNGEATDDGLTTESELTITGFHSSLLPADLKLSYYSVTNTLTEEDDAVDIDENDRIALDADYKIDLREVVVPPLAVGEEIRTIEFNYKGHGVFYHFNPRLRFVDKHPLPWPSEITIAYTDDGGDTTDGLTTESELTITGFDGLEGIVHSDIKLSSFVLTNTSSGSATTNDLPPEDQLVLSSDWKVDLRDVKDPLGDHEKIHSITFSHSEGSNVSYTFDPALWYVDTLPPAPPAPVLALATNTGDSPTDAFTTNATITITAQANSTITLSLETNGTAHAFTSSETNSFTMPTDGSALEVDLLAVTSIAAPTGNNTNAFVVSATATLYGETSEASDDEEFTLVAPPTQAEVDAISLSLTADTGDDNDKITTNNLIVVSGTESIPDGATLTFSVVTNGANHSYSLTTQSGTSVPAEGQLFGLVSLSELLVVSITPRLTRHAHSVTKAAFEYTLIPWPASITVAYTDDGDNTSDGVTTKSELTITSLVGSGLPPADIKLTYYVLTNLDSGDEDSIQVAEGDQVALNADYKIDMREVKASLASGEKITSLALNYKGHTVSYMFDPNLRYIDAHPTWPSEITIAYADNGANTSDGITTKSELTIGGFDGFVAADIKLSSFVITNTRDSNSTTSNVPSSEQPALSADWKVDMRDVKDPLGSGEKIYSVTFTHTNGSNVSYTFDPALDYSLFGVYVRKFAVLGGSTGIAINSDGILIINSTNTEKIQFFNTDGSRASVRIGNASVSNFGSLGNATNKFENPVDVAIGSDNKLYVADQGNRRISIFNADFSHDASISMGNNVHLVGLHSHGGFVHVPVVVGLTTYRMQTYAESNRSQKSNLALRVSGLAVDADGIYHLANNDNDRVEAWRGSPTTGFSSRGSSHRYFMRVGSVGANSSNPVDVVVGPKTGRIYVSDSRRHQVLVLSYNGSRYSLVGTLGKSSAGSSGNGNGEFNQPHRMLIHDGKLYVVDKANNRVQVFDVPE